MVRCAKCESTLSGKQTKYCSLQCQRSDRPRAAREFYPCLWVSCSTLISKGKYCSRSCATSATNTGSPKRRAHQKTCVVCGSLYQTAPSSRSKTCSKGCAEEHKRSKWTPETLFVVDSTIPRGRVKRWALKWGLLEEKCSSCGIVEWMGEPAPLDLDHINGVRYDHRLSNIRILCANCHRLTETHGGKNIPRMRNLGIVS